jgi:hypothetical protein|nr:MAG TPA: hypothetical protein [Caudoviricetes sp.]
MENSIEEDIERLKLCSSNQCHICGRYEKEECMLERNRCEQHILSAYKKILKENKKLKVDNLEYQRIQDISDVRPYRKRYLEERRKEENDLLYPDADEIYERYYKIKEENEKLKNKDTNKVSLEIGKSKTIKKIYVSDKQIGLGILTNWTGRKLDFLFANKINELVQAVNQLSKKTEE